MSWNGTRVLVTGGASFIGSHLTDALVARGATVRVADNLSSGLVANLAGHLERGAIEFHQVDLKDPATAAAMCDGVEVVFHNAADHGGRGYVDLHQVACATNLTLDGMLFAAAHKAGVQKVVYASSGCVYPNHLQTDPTATLYLEEALVAPPYDADNLYGWAKLMGELTLRAYHRQYGMKTASCRYFTVYGPRARESHAVIAMIARAFIDQNPFEVWGTGQQIRNWTHVDDIVSATILAAERIDDGTAINVGTTERISVLEAVQEILRYTKKELRLVFDPSKPTGPYNRVCDNALAKERLGWEPKVPFRKGLHATIDWYFREHEAKQVAAALPRMLTEREHA
jgi:nucleoside-diphosphate-sugar epimerase